MNTNIEALKTLYVELGGSAETVAGITIIPDMLNALAQIATPFISAADNGKVVVDGALVAQTAHADVTENGTIDTTTNNSVKVAVPNPNSVVTVTGTVGSPWGDIVPSELATALAANNATAHMTIGTGTEKAFATVVNNGMTIQFSGMQALELTDPEVSFIGGYSVVYVASNGQVSLDRWSVDIDMGTDNSSQLSTDTATVLTVIYHPLPTV